MEATSLYCKFRKDGRCTLGYHGGRPHEGNCRACISAGENNKEHFDSLPSIVRQGLSAATAMTKFACSKFKQTDPETLAVREAACKSCEFWDSTALRGKGRCRKCGCATWAKIRMNSEKCPIGKW